MPVQRNLERFNEIKFGIAIATFYVTTEPLWERILIRTLFISTTLCLVSSALHIANTFEGQFTGNLAMSLMLSFGCLQLLLKTLFLRYHRNEVLELLDNAQSEYNSFDNKKLNAIAENNFTKFRNIWEIFFKFGKAGAIVSAIGFSIENAITGKSGVITEIPLIPNDIPYYTQIMLFAQFVFCPSAAICIFYTDISMAFFGFEIMAAADIIYDYISENKDQIQKDPDFFKIITIKYCKIVDTIKQFNNIMSILYLIQFIASAFLSVAIFFFIRLYPKHPAGYTTALIILFELFVPCLFGEFIKIKMERLSTALYSTNWPDLNLKDQKSFLLVLGMTQREYGLRAAGMYDVNIYTFIKIVKMAASWCAFIFTLDAVLDKEA